MNLWVGAVRSGKTTATLWKWLDYVRNGPPGNLAMIGKTERTLKRNMLDPLAELLGPRRFTLVSGSGECFIFGRRIYLAGANNEAAVTKIQGLTLAGALCDEATTYPESFWTMLLSRLSIAGAQLFATMNPDSPAHWMKRKFIDRQAELGIRVFHFTLEDNPSLDPAYVAALKREYVGLWHKRYIQGLWALAEGAVYDMFDEGLHVVGELPVLTTHWAGADYGTTNPTVFLPATLGEERFYVHDEWRWDSKERGRQKTDAQYSRDYREWAARIHQERSLEREWPRWSFVDPSAASFRLQLFQDGVPGVVEADNSVLDGIRDVSTLLGSGRLLFHRATTGALVDELMGYGWDPEAQKRGEDRPLKLADHGCFVAGTLVETSTGPKPIETIKPGERVLTRQGFKPVVDAAMTNANAKVYRVSLSNGRQITGSGNHPIWVADKGWVRLDTLRYGDTIETCEMSLSNSMESNSEGIPTRRIGRTGCTSRRALLTSNAALAACIRRFGKLLTARFPMGSLSTIEMTTRSTTILRTLSASPLTNMSHVTSGQEAILSTWPLSGTLLHGGIDPSKAGPGIARTLSTPGSYANRCRRYVTNVANHSRRLLAGKRIGSVPTLVSQHGVETQALMMSSGSVKSAESSSPSINTPKREPALVHVVAVSALSKPEPVYNLTVADAPEYFAGGVLVHNCDTLRYVVRGTRNVWRHWTHGNGYPGVGESDEREAA